MKKHLKLRKDENLSQWIDRLVEYYVDNDVTIKEIEEILHEVSVQSYIAGSNAMASITNGFTRR